MARRPKFTATIARSLIQTPHIKNNRAPRFSNQIFNGSMANAVANAPPNVTKVATHFSKLTLFNFFHTFSKCRPCHRFIRTIIQQYSAAVFFIHRIMEILYIIIFLFNGEVIIKMSVFNRQNIHFPFPQYNFSQYWQPKPHTLACVHQPTTWLV